MPSATTTPTLEERFRARAHEIWEREGRPEGRDLAHWHQAEAEITAEDAVKAPKRRSAAPANRSRRKEAVE